MSRHTIETEIEVRLSFPGMDDDTAHPTLVITYDYSPGRPAFTPRGEYAPIDPPEPPEVSFVSAEVVKTDGLSPSVKRVQDWAADWLDSDDGYNVACDHAEASRHPDPDDAYERQRDESDAR